MVAVELISIVPATLSSSVHTMTAASIESAAVALPMTTYDPAETLRVATVTKDVPTPCAAGELTEVALLGPIGPVAPVSPFGPGGPYSPAGPCSPAGPRSPCRDLIADLVSFFAGIEWFLI